MKFIYPILALIFIGGIALFFALRGSSLPTDSIENIITPIQNSEITETVPSTNVNSVDSITLSLRKQFGTDATLLFETQKGSVRMNNFYRDAEFILEDGHATIKRLDDYTLTYVAIKKSFQITITSPDILVTTTRAEKDLIATLGITPQELCKMNPVVFVDKGFDPRSEYTKEFPLSFCPSQ